MIKAITLLVLKLIRRAQTFQLHDLFELLDLFELAELVQLIEVIQSTQMNRLHVAMSSSSIKLAQLVTS